MNSPRTPALRRIQADIRELEKHPSPRYNARPLDDNMFEWHFTIRGPNGTDFEGGVYHGRILLPTDYPFKPPNIVFMTKNGRFEVGTKICLSISAHHEESWQPAWGIRTMLEAIISFLPSEGSGAIGALDWSKEERVLLAKESHKYECPFCGLAVSLLSTDDEGVDKIDDEIAKQIATLNMKVSVDSNNDNDSKNMTPVKLSLDSPSISTDIIGTGMTNNLMEQSIEESKDLNDTSRTPITTNNNNNNDNSNYVPETPPSVRDVRRRVIGARAAATINEVDGVETTETRSTANKKDIVDIILLFIQYLIGAMIVYLLLRKVKVSIEDITEL